MTIITRAPRATDINLQERLRRWSRTFTDFGGATVTRFILEFSRLVSRGTPACAEVALASLETRRCIRFTRRAVPSDSQRVHNKLVPVAQGDGMRVSSEFHA
jgi:hypothetical protein